MSPTASDFAGFFSHSKTRQELVRNSNRFRKARWICLKRNYPEMPLLIIAEKKCICISPLKLNHRLGESPS